LIGNNTFEKPWLQYVMPMAQFAVFKFGEKTKVSAPLHPVNSALPKFTKKFDFIS